MFTCPYEKQCQDKLKNEQARLDEERLKMLGTKKNFLYKIRSFLISRAVVEKPKCNSEGGCSIYGEIENQNFSSFLESDLCHEMNKNLANIDKYRSLRKIR